MGLHQAVAVAPAMPLPKYHQIYLVLREQLAEGRFADGLPGELRLVQQFGVARVTVRKALERLAADGLIERKPGRGTTARAALPADARQRPAHLYGLLENIVTMGLQTKVTVVSCELLAASAAVAQQLALPLRTPVQKAVRVRATAEGPLSFITTHVPADLAAGFGSAELAKKPMLLLLEDSGVHIGRATQAVSARLADAEVAAHLGIAVGSALLAVSRLVFDVRQRPVQWLQGLYRPDRYQLDMQLSRVGGIDAKVWVGTTLAVPFH
jgi:GntR family transcriptional regulator